MIRRRDELVIKLLTFRPGIRTAYALLRLRFHGYSSLANGTLCWAHHA
jgi:hypothetical protein